MVVPGKGNAMQDDDATIAAATIRCLAAHVPADVPGVVFLSGGMSDEQATSRLNEMNRMSEATAPHGRCRSPTAARCRRPRSRRGAADPRNVAAGQAALAHRAKMNGLARDGAYDPAMESAA